MVAAASLRIIQAEPAAKVGHVSNLAVAPSASQNCSTCRLAPHCWRKELSPSQIAVNLLVCRIKQGIREEESWKALFLALKPKILCVAKSIRSGDSSGDSFDDIIASVQTEIVQAVNGYVMGERAHPVHWLFAPRIGAISRWQSAEFQRRKVRRNRASDAHEVAVELSRPWSRAYAVEASEDEVDDHTVTARGEVIRGTIEDGVSLSAREYRVMKIVLGPIQKDAEISSRYMNDALGIPLKLALESFRLIGRRAVDYSRLAFDALQTRGHVGHAETRRLRRERLLAAAGVRGYDQHVLNARERAEVLKLSTPGGAPRLSDRELVMAYGVPIQEIIANHYKSKPKQKPRIGITFRPARAPFVALPVHVVKSLPPKSAFQDAHP